jgi:hypothetical protein
MFGFDERSLHAWEPGKFVATSSVDIMINKIISPYSCKCGNAPITITIRLGSHTIDPKARRLAINVLFESVFGITAKFCSAIFVIQNETF